MQLLIAVLLWCVGWVLNAANNRILFKYEDSVFAKLDGWHGRWWKLNSHPKLKRFWFLPMIWDGWHFTKWLEHLAYFGMLFAFVPSPQLAIFFGGIGFLIFFVFYKYTFNTGERQ